MPWNHVNQSSSWCFLTGSHYINHSNLTPLKNFNHFTSKYQHSTTLSQSSKEGTKSLQSCTSQFSRFLSPLSSTILAAKLQNANPLSSTLSPRFKPDPLTLDTCTDLRFTKKNELEAACQHSTDQYWIEPNTKIDLNSYIANDNGIMLFRK